MSFLSMRSLPFLLCLVLAVAVLRLPPALRIRGVCAALFLSFLMFMPGDLGWDSDTTGRTKAWLILGAGAAVLALRSRRGGRP
jgi:hypothetical protein